MNCHLRYLVLVLGFSLLCTQSYSQPLSLRVNKCTNTTGYVIIIQAHEAKFDKYLQDHLDVKLLSKHHDAYFLKMPTLYSIQLLQNQPFVIRLEPSLSQAVPLMDSSRILNNVDSVHIGAVPLLGPYTGRGIIVGIIDFGSDWRHPDFYNSSSQTRIHSIWDQNKDSIPPTGYTYGMLWKQTQIDSGVCSFVPPVSQNSHGTNVAGIAVGNGRVRSFNTGIAPEAKIVTVSIKNDNTWLSNLADGVDYIFSVADSLRLPAVVNLSLGSYDGSHDGRDLATRILESKLSKAGRLLVSAAGNAGNLDQHIEMKPQGDTLFTDFRHNNAFGGTYFNFWADSADTRNLTIGIQADSQSGLSPVSKKNWFSFGTRFLDSLRIYGYYEDSIIIENSSNSNIGKAYFYVLKQENTVNFQCYIVPKFISHLWRFTATGSGKLDMWVHPSLQTSSAVWTSPLPDSTQFPEFRKYKTPDRKSSIVTGFQCSDKIITVGNYVNKYGILDIDSIYRPIGGKQNEIASNSSTGPTRDGRLKPDIVASGGQTMTTVDSIVGRNMSMTAAGRRKLGLSGKYSVGGGTSMSSPVVAGVAALLLQKSPKLTADQVRYLMIKTVKKDSFTGTIPNITYGHGKINGFQLLTHPITYGCRDTGSINYNPHTDFEESTLCIRKVYGCMDTGSINYNPLANVDNGSCIQKVYGCMDTGSINFNSLANVDNGSCIRKVYGCMDTGSINYNPLANVDNGSCIRKVYGCMDTGSINYNTLANVDNGSCMKKVYGCMDSFAYNYNPQANRDDGSCRYSNLSVLSVNSDGWSIFPSPSQGKISIQSNHHPLTVVRIYGVDSKLIFHLLLSQNIDIDMTNYPSGHYLVVLEASGQQWSQAIRIK